MLYHAPVNPFSKKIIDGGRFDTDQKPRNEPIIKFYLYPLEYFPSFWGKNSTCDHSKVLFEKKTVVRVLDIFFRCFRKSNSSGLL